MTVGRFPPFSFLHQCYDYLSSPYPLIHPYHTISYHPPPSSHTSKQPANLFLILLFCLPLCHCLTIAQNISLAYNPQTHTASLSQQQYRTIIYCMVSMHTGVRGGANGTRDNIHMFLQGINSLLRVLNLGQEFLKLGPFAFADGIVFHSFFAFGEGVASWGLY